MTLIWKSGISAFMEFQIILMTVIAFSAVLSILSVIFHWLLSPVKENQVRIETEIKENQTKIETEIKDNRAKIETEIKHLQSDMNQVKTDIKQLLSRKA